MLRATAAPEPLLPAKYYFSGIAGGKQAPRLERPAVPDSPRHPLAARLTFPPRLAKEGSVPSPQMLLARAKTLQRAAAPRWLRASPRRRRVAPAPRRTQAATIRAGSS